MRINFNTRKFNQQIDKAAADLIAVAPEVLKNQGRLAARDLAKATPPFKARGGAKGTFKQSWAVQKKAGMGAVERDVRRVYIQLQEMGVYKNAKNQRFGGILQKATKAQDITSVRKLLKGAKFSSLIRYSAESGFHTKAKGRRRKYKGAGTLIKSGMKKVIVIRPNELKKYIKQVQEGVGEAMAGWLPMARKLGLKLPKWITRHDTPGTFLDRSRDKVKPYIRFSNHIRFSRDMSHLNIVKAVLQNRKRSMKKQAEKILAYRAKQLNQKR